MHTEVPEFPDAGPQDGVSLWLRHNWSRRPRRFEFEVEGARIACHGWNLQADLPVIVLVHGFRAHARWWDHIAPALAARHRVVAISLSGMGDSGRRAGYSRAQYGREALAAGAYLGDDRPTVIAHSFGGIGAALAARAHPERVRRLIVIDSAFPAPGDENREIEKGVARYYPDGESARSRFHLRPPGKWPNQMVLDYIGHHSVVETEKGWTWKFDPAAAASLNAESYYEDLFGITVPVDIIHGDQTEIMTPERRAALRTMAQNIGEEIVVPACHHHVLIEQPVALVTALNALLANERR